MKLSKIQLDDDLDKVAELIYSTDPFLYPDLFGSLEQAKKLLPILINDSKSIFYRDHIYVCKKDNNIVGIVSIMPHGKEWNFSSIRLAYMELNYAINPAVHAVSKYFEDTYSRIGIGASACNISVDKNHRQEGIGSFMMEMLIQIAGRSNIELSVLADNIPAINLYKKYGFITIKESLEYGGYNKEKVRCYSMVRLATI